MKDRWTLEFVVPTLALALVAGLASGCGSSVDTGVPPPKASTADDAKTAADKVMAGLPKGGMASPGFSSKSKSKKK